MVNTNNANRGVQGAAQRRWRAGFLGVILAFLCASAQAQSLDSTGTRASFIELSADKAELYVQEQLILTVQLYFTNALINGELSEPISNNAVIETLGQQQEFSRVRDGQRYRMIERRYAVYPQTSGQLSLAPIEFEGRFRSADGRPQRIRDSEQLYDLPVNAIPAAFSGNTWLPAATLELAESGLPANNKVTRGDSLTRQLTLTATGLPATTLPPFPALAVPGLRSYPEPAQRANDINANGLTSALQQTNALVPVQTGELTLAEIRIPWWDTQTDSEKVAIIPARTLVVSAAVGMAAQTPANPQAAAAPNGAGGRAENSVQETDFAANRSANTGGFWPWLALLLGAGWGVTGAAFWLIWRKRRPSANMDNSSDRDDSEMFKNLQAAAGRNSADTPRLLLRWMNQQYPDQHFQSCRQIIEFSQNQPLANALAELEHQRYSAEQAAQQRSVTPNSALQKAIRQLRQKPTDFPAKSLKPLYPKTISVNQTGINH